VSVQEKVSAIEFAQDTGLDAEGIRAAGQRAAEAGRGMLGNKIVEVGTNGSSVAYRAKGPGGLVTQMNMVVHWGEDGGDRRKVQFSVGEFLTSQSKLFYFIPLGPKTVPALSAARRFAEALRAELAAA
jgi:hypothetical protein